MSGVMPNDDCVKEFEKLKTGRTYKAVTFKIAEDGKEVHPCGHLEAKVRTTHAHSGVGREAKRKEWPTRTRRVLRRDDCGDD